MKRDLVHNIDAAQSLAPKALTATGTGSNVDLQGYYSCLVLFNIGAWTDGTHTPVVEHSADGTTFTDAGTDGVLQGTLAAVSGTAGQNTVQRVGYIGTNRYVRAKITVSGATTGALSGASVIRGSADRKPLP